MPIQKIKSGRVITVEAATYVGDKGIIFYDEDVAQLRLSDGVTPGGIPFSGGGGPGYILPPATISTLGGVKVGPGLAVSPDGTLSANVTATYTLVTATTARLGGVKIGSGLSITADGTISAVATSTFVLNTATASTLGGVKIGSGLSITGDGTISAVATSTYVLTTATANDLGGIKIGAGLNITGDGTVSAVVTSTYQLPIASTSTLGGIKVGANLSIDPDGTLNANTSTTGVSDSFKTIKVSGEPDLIASGADTVEFKEGTGILITTSATSMPYKSITITSTGFGNIDGGLFDTVFDTTTLQFDGGSP